MLFVRLPSSHLQDLRNCIITDATCALAVCRRGRERHYGARMVSQHQLSDAIGKSANGRGRAVGSQIDFTGWVPTAFSVVVNGVGAVGLIDFTGGAMVPLPEDAASKQRWRSGI